MATAPNRTASAVLPSETTVILPAGFARHVVLVGKSGKILHTHCMAPTEVVTDKRALDLLMRDAKSLVQRLGRLIDGGNGVDG